MASQGAKRVRLAVVGTGRHAMRAHLPGLAMLRDEGRVELAGVCDVIEDRARQAADRFGFAQVHTDYRAMLDRAEFDGVAVYTGAEHIPEVACFFLSQSVPTLMEKPPGLSSADTRRVVEAAERTGVANMVAFNRRFTSILIRGRDRVAELGPIHQVACEFTRCNRSAPGAVCGSGLHGIDALRWLCGDVAELVVRRAPVNGEEGLDFAALLVFRSGATGSFIQTHRGGGDIERYVIHGPNATSHVRVPTPWSIDPPGLLHHYRMHECITVDNSRWDSRRKHLYFLGGFYHENLHFIEQIARGPKTACSPDAADALKSMQLAEAIQAGRSKTF